MTKTITPQQHLQTELLVAQQHLEKNDFATAEQIYRKILQNHPDCFPALYNMALMSLKLGQLDNCILFAKEILKQDPNNAKGISLLAEALYIKNDYENAIPYLETYLKTDNDDTHSQFRLATCLYHIARYNESLDVLYKLERKAPSNTEIMNMLATNYHAVGQLDKVAQLYQKSIALEPHKGQHHFNYANYLFFAGELEQACQYYRNALQYAPGFTECYVQITNATKDKDKLQELRKELIGIIKNNTFANKPKSLKFIHSALGKLEEKLGNNDCAFEHYQKAALLCHKEDVAARLMELNQKRVACIKEVFTKTLFVSKEFPSSYDLQPIFILGMPRSGTSLVEHIISSHPNVAACGELPYFNNMVKAQVDGKKLNNTIYPYALQNANQEQLQTLGNAYLDGVKQHQLDNKTIFTDKLPLNYFYVGAIRLIFPQAKIIHCQRHPIDVCFSNFTQIFVDGNEQSYDFDALTNIYKTYNTLMQHWNNVAPNAFYTITYEKLVSNSKDEIPKLIKYCGLPWDKVCLTPEKNTSTMRTASADQVRKAIYQNATMRWKKFEKYLVPLVQKLEKEKQAYEAALTTAGND